MSPLNPRDAEIAAVVEGRVGSVLAHIEQALATLRNTSVEEVRADLAAKGHRLAASTALTSKEAA